MIKILVALIAIAALCVLGIALIILDAKLRPVGIEETPGPCTCQDCSQFDWDAAEQQMREPHHPDEREVTS